MNKKGLTLVEMIAVLVVLSIVATVVTPNIAKEIKDYRNRTLNAQLSTIEGATKNWVADNVNAVDCTNDDRIATKVSMITLKNGAYVEENMKNPKGGDLNDAFGLVYCSTVEDETKNLATNYKYEYGAYENLDDYYKKRAIEYVKDKGNSLGTVVVSTNVLITDKYLYTSMKDYLTNVVTTTPSINIEVKITEGINEYNYEAKILN